MFISSGWGGLFGAFRPSQTQEAEKTQEAEGGNTAANGSGAPKQSEPPRENAAASKSGASSAASAPRNDGAEVAAAGTETSTERADPMKQSPGTGAADGRSVNAGGAASGGSAARVILDAQPDEADHIRRVAEAAQDRLRTAQMMRAIEEVARMSPAPKASPGMTGELLEPGDEAGASAHVVGADAGGPRDKSVA